MERSADWMDQARGDLQHARSDVEGAFYDWACFSAQQAAEKAVKALFQRMGAVVWGHSVADLLDELAQRQAVPEDIRDAASVWLSTASLHPCRSGKAGRVCRKDRPVL